MYHILFAVVFQNSSAASFFITLVGLLMEISIVVLYGRADLSFE